MTLLLAVQLSYWLYFFRNLGIRETSSRDDFDNEPPVSIIVCSKDAVILLAKNLPKLKNQDYPEFEIVISDDFSTDETKSYVNRFKNEWIETVKVNYHKVTKNKNGKKQALLEGMQVARHNWVLLTDADCMPISSQWIRQMMASRNDIKNRIILGYSPYRWGETWLSQWVHYEAWSTALQYLSLAQRGLPYMGVGRNMAYTKDLIKPEIMEKYAHLASGDDDLTIMQIADKHNTSVCLDPISFVYTDTPPTWKAYIKQKRRHYSTASAYTKSTQTLLAGYSLSQILFFVVGVALVYSSSSGWESGSKMGGEKGWALSGGSLWGIGCYVLRMVIILPIVHRLIKTLDARFSLINFILFDLIQAFYYLIFSFAVLIPQKNKW